MRPETHVINTIQINGPLEAIFDLVTTPRFWPQWRPATIGVAGVTERPVLLHDIAYAVALPACVGTEVITRGLIALRDTRTPFFTNIGQLTGRAVIMAFFVGRFGIVTIPAALAVTATLEAITLGVVLYLKLQGRMAKI